MNNDSTPTPAADLPTTSESNNNEPADSVDSVQRRQDAQTPAQKKAHSQTKKKYEFVNGLMTNLDVLIYAELCILYYMDCSFFRLLLRVLAQMTFLTPKPTFIPPMPQHRPYIGAIFGPNIICILLHMFTARSEAGESMRGYLHGGIIIDLIGQKGPTSKLHLVLLDVLLTVLQCFMLAVHVERERLSTVLTTFVSPAPVADQPRAEVVSTQDHDAEERGVMRDGVTNDDDIEMQSLAARTDGPSRNEEADTERSQERERLLEEPTPREEEDDSPLDMFWSGTAIVADFHVLQNLRTQWNDYGNATGSALQTAGFTAEFAAITANRRINAATQRFQRGVESLA